MLMNHSGFGHGRAIGAGSSTGAGQIDRDDWDRVIIADEPVGDRRGKGATPSTHIASASVTPASYRLIWLVPSNQVSLRYRCARCRTGVKLLLVPPATSLLLGAIETVSEPDAGSWRLRGCSLLLRARGSVSSVRPGSPGRHLRAGRSGTEEARRRWRR
jgi:hypothetical protein